MALIGLLAGLAVVVASQTALSQVAPGLSHLAAWRIGGGLALSTVTTFVFLLIVYRTLPNTEVTTRQVLPGAAIATLLLQLTFESLPLYVRSVEGLPALKAFARRVPVLLDVALPGWATSSCWAGRHLVVGARAPAAASRRGRSDGASGPSPQAPASASV